MSNQAKYYVSVNLDSGAGGNSHDIETLDQAIDYANELVSKFKNIESVTVYRVNEGGSVKEMYKLFR